MYPVGIEDLGQDFDFKIGGFFIAFSTIVAASILGCLVIQNCPVCS